MSFLSRGDLSTGWFVQSPRILCGIGGWIRSGTKLQPWKLYKKALKRTWPESLRTPICVQSTPRESLCFQETCNCAWELSVLRTNTIQEHCSSSIYLINASISSSSYRIYYIDVCVHYVQYIHPPDNNCSAKVYNIPCLLHIHHFF